MKLTEFDYSYPEELVAQEPLPQRGASRMMVIDRRMRSWEHRNVSELPRYVREGDVLVINDSRVRPMRLFGELAGGKPVELLLVKSLEEPGDGRPEIWKCLIRKAKRYGYGDQFFFGISATARAVGHDGMYLLVEFMPGHRERAMERRGVPPLPPYIRRDGLESYTPKDFDRYQTIYAQRDGSAAAPTAGLHFSQKLLDDISSRGVEVVSITLHVGLDTFQPVRVDDITLHRMHGEWYEISWDVADRINAAKKEGRRVVAVGTTTVRALESSWKDGLVHPGDCTTNLFITPGYIFRVVEGMLTNFHQPRSTLLMMVSAFAGREFLLNCYQDAISEKYRLFSYGDCMAIF